MAEKVSSVDVVGLGENVMDTLLLVDRYPARGTKTHLLTSSRQPGGQVASALVACRHLGLKARYVGKFGDDADAKQQIRSLKLESIDFEFCPRFQTARVGPQSSSWTEQPGNGQSTGTATLVWRLNRKN